MEWAFLKDSVVIDVVICDEETARAAAAQRGFTAVLRDPAKVNIGDTYTDGKFFRQVLNEATGELEAQEVK